MRDKKVSVKRIELLKELEKNMEIHVKDFGDMMDAYFVDVVRSADELRKKVAELDSDFDPRNWSFPSKPVSYEKDYSVAIRMFEMEVNDVVELTEEEFRQFVCDEWNWKRKFDMMKTAYSR